MEEHLEDRTQAGQKKREEEAVRAQGGLFSTTIINVAHLYDRTTIIVPVRFLPYHIFFLLLIIIFLFNTKTHIRQIFAATVTVDHVSLARDIPLRYSHRCAAYTHLSNLDVPYWYWCTVASRL